MSIKILWRSIVFVLTLGFIYLAFPILIVPSSLPAIKAMFIQQEFPNDPFLPSPSNTTSQPIDARIYQLQIPQTPTLSDKIKLILDLHQQGMAKIFPKD